MGRLRQWVSRRVTWVTLIITILGAGLIVAGCPSGLPASEYADAWVAYSWFGVFFAQLISLGAWVALRDGPWLRRLPGPAALFILLLVACAVGERLNSVRPSGTLACGAAIATVTACLLFFVLRRLGWRIGPAQTQRVRFSLQQLFLAVSYLAVASAIWGWCVTDSQGAIALGRRRVEWTDVLGVFAVATIATVPFCLLAIPAVGLVMTSRKRYAGWLIGLVVIFVMGFALSGLLTTSPSVVMIPGAFVLLVLWLFAGYRACGYGFAGSRSNQRSAGCWFVSGACLMVAATVSAAIVLRDFRDTSAFEAPWKRVGVFPARDEENRLVGATFYRSGTGITREGIEALKTHASLERVTVECPATPQQMDWILELRSVKRVYLIGPHLNDKHLKRFYSAHHLERVDFYDTKITAAEAAKLQRALKDCAVDPDGNLLLESPVKTRKAPVRAVSE